MTRWSDDNQTLECERDDNHIVTVGCQLEVDGVGIPSPLVRSFAWPKDDGSMYVCLARPQEGQLPNILEVSLPCRLELFPQRFPNRVPSILVTKDMKCNRSKAAVAICNDFGDIVSVQVYGIVGG